MGELDRAQVGERWCCGSEERGMEVAGFKGEVAEVRESQEEVEKRRARELRTTGESERGETAVGERRGNSSNDGIVDGITLAAEDRKLLEQEDVGGRCARPVGLRRKLLLSLEEEGEDIGDVAVGQDEGERAKRWEPEEVVGVP